MHDAPQGQPGLFGGAHEPLGHSGCGDIAGNDRDLCAFFQLRQDRPLLIGGLGSTVQDNAPGAAVDEPAGNDQTDTAETAGDDVGAVRSDDRLLFTCTERRARKTFDISVLLRAKRSRRRYLPTPAR